MSNIGVLARGRGNLEVAEQLLRHAVELSPDAAFAYFDLGRDLDENSAINLSLGWHPLIGLCPDGSCAAALRYRSPRLLTSSSWLI